ncbi:MAG: phosphodiesterase [Neomegalonema sp.]|nr:phosphodiesterase [Neomegalonema sp.]
MSASRLAPGFLSRPFAHRGLHEAAGGVIENSASAVLAAIAGGYGIEIDLQRAGDHEPVVFHDPVLDRLTEARGPVDALPSGALRQMRLRGSEDGIVSLPDLFNLVAYRAPLLLEIKDPTGRMAPISDAGHTRFLHRIAELASEYKGARAVMSFNPHVIAWFTEHAPQIPRGLVACAQVDPKLGTARNHALAQMQGAEALGLDFLSYDACALPDPRVAELGAQGVAVICWTIRDLAAAKRVAPHVDQITFEGFSPPRP